MAKIEELLDVSSSPFLLLLSARFIRSWQGVCRNVVLNTDLKNNTMVLQQFASKHKPQTFSRVCLRLKRGVYRWKLKCFTAHVTCHIEKP